MHAFIPSRCLQPLFSDTVLRLSVGPMLTEQSSFPGLFFFSDVTGKSPFSCVLSSFPLVCWHRTYNPTFLWLSICAGKGPSHWVVTVIFTRTVPGTLLECSIPRNGCFLSMGRFPAISLCSSSVLHTAYTDTSDLLTAGFNLAAQGRTKRMWKSNSRWRHAVHRQTLNCICWQDLLWTTDIFICQNQNVIYILA